MKLLGAGRSPKPGEGALYFDTTRGPLRANASVIGMKEDPKHWALKASFGATVGEGFREQWRPPPEPRPALAPLPATSYGSQRLSLGFGETGKLLTFTALHAAVAASVCDIRIDDRGFVVNTTEGAVVTPTFWGPPSNGLALTSKV